MNLFIFLCLILGGLRSQAEINVFSPEIKEEELSLMKDSVQKNSFSNWIKSQEDMTQISSGLLSLGEQFLNSELSNDAFLAEVEKLKLKFFFSPDSQIFLIHLFQKKFKETTMPANILKSLCHFSALKKLDYVDETVPVCPSVQMNRSDLKIKLSAKDQLFIDGRLVQPYEQSLKIPLGATQVYFVSDQKERIIDLQNVDQEHGLDIKKEPADILSGSCENFQIKSGFFSDYSIPASQIVFHFPGACRKNFSTDHGPIQEPTPALPQMNKNWFWAAAVIIGGYLLFKDKELVIEK